MTIIGLICLFSLIVLIDLRSLLQTNQRKKAGLIYSLLLTAGFAISLLLAIHKAPASPSAVIEIIVKSFTGG